MSDNIEIIEAHRESFGARRPGDAIVVVLPEEIVDGRARFSGDVNTLVKSLREHGVEARYSHGADEREWMQLLGEKELAFALAVAAEMFGSGAWDVLRVALSDWFERLPKPGREVRLELLIEDDVQSRQLWLSGSGDEVVAALDRVPEVVRALSGESDDAESTSEGDS